VIRTFFWALILLGPSCATTEPERNAPPPPTKRELSKSPDDIDSRVEEAERTIDALVEGGLPERIHEVWDGWNRTLEQNARLRLGMNYTAVFQHASAAAFGPRDAGGGDFDFFGRWQAIDKSGKWPGFVYFQTEARHRYTNISPAELGPSVGSLLGTTTTFNAQSFSLAQLYWDHGSFEDRFRYRVGKMDPGLLWDAGRYVSDNYAFLSQAFSDTAPMALPERGLGVLAAAYPHGELYVLAGLHDANGRKGTSGFDSLGQGEFFYALELGATPKFGEIGGGMYHATFWYSDAKEQAGVPSGHGFAVTLEQEFGANGAIVPFVRYAYGEGAGRRVRQLLAAGLGVEQVFGQSDDIAGVGLAWAQPTDRALRDQYVLEVFYRFHLTPYVHVTPDIQLLIDPSYAPDEDAVWVFGLRLRVLF